MGRLARGREEALEVLHGRYASLIGGLAARSLGPESGEEISQEVFLAVWQHAAILRPGAGDVPHLGLADHPDARHQRAPSARPEAPDHIAIRPAG